MSVRAPLGFALLVALAAFSWWLSRRGEEPAPPAASARQTGYFMHDADLDQADATGRVNLRVHATDALQTTADGEVQLSALHVDYLAAPRRAWVMTAAHGTLPPSGKSILLDGDVRLTAADRGNLVVTTRHLRFDVGSELATTEDAVRVDVPPHFVNARGLRADLKHETLKLESAVDGTFAR